MKWEIENVKFLKIGREIQITDRLKKKKEKKEIYHRRWGKPM